MSVYLEPKGKIFLLKNRIEIDYKSLEFLPKEKKYEKLNKRFFRQTNSKFVFISLRSIRICVFLLKK
jgi:hypothetical protein